MGSPVREYASMRKSVFMLAVIGAACSSVAFAAEVKKDKAHIPAVKATTMSDADMDKVTAGASNATTFDDSGNILKIHHSSPESMENGAIQNMNHFK